MTPEDTGPELWAHARAEFEAAIASAVLPYQMAQLNLNTDEEEQFLQREVERMLYQPKLPNAGQQERMWLEKLKAFSRDESLVVNIKAAASRYATGLESLLPNQGFIRQGDGWLTLPGCYYTRNPVTPKTNKVLYDAAMDLRQSCGKDYNKRWLADFLLEGLPEAVSNFKMETLYLLQDANGQVTRLVRLVNKKGEVSQGRQIGGAVILSDDMFASAEKFRQWCMRWGNFNWGVGSGAGNIELQMLHADMSEDVAYRVVRLIEYCGWHELEKQDEEATNLVPGIWFFEECAYVNGECILPDEDGIFWHKGHGYAFARKGRETEFTQGRPQMRPDQNIETAKLDTKGWDETARCGMKLGTKAKNQLQMTGSFFREACRRFYDVVGDYEGWLAVGAMLGYVAAPEIFRKRKMFPGAWVSGQAGSGKTTVVSWLMSFPGFEVDSGLGLASKNVTAVGIMCQLENYSNLPVWLDEFRQAIIDAAKEAILRDGYNRQLAVKWSPDGFQRVIRTAPFVSGESTSCDAATRSRYPHALISEQKRKVDHYEWMQAHQKWFFLFWRYLLENRREFLKAVMTQIEFWMIHPDLVKVPSRDRITHAVSYAAFAAATAIFDSHGADEVGAFLKFMIQHVSSVIWRPGCAKGGQL